MSAVAHARHLLSSRPDRQPVAVADARAALAAHPQTEAVEHLQVEEQQAWVRRERRRPRGTGLYRLRCPACHRFTASLSKKCGCGWDPVSGWGQ